MIVGQLAILAYNSWAQVPTEQAREANEAFVNRLRSLPGEMLVFNHGAVNHLAGKTTYLHSAAYSDAVGGGAYPPRTEDNRWRR